MNLCESIREKRIRLGLSHKDFADALSLGKSGDRTIRLWEKGELMPSRTEYNAIRNFASTTPFLNTNENIRFTFIDLFAGIGGIRLPFQELGGKCVFTSEWDKFAQKTYRINFGEEPQGDITKISNDMIPSFDILLGGFPCQPFSQAGLHKGIEDTRGTLFFHIAKIIEGKRPKAFLLENVKQLVGHNKGRTFSVVIEQLENLNYAVSYKILRARDFGVPQNRERIYIVGFDKDYYDISENFEFSFPVPPCSNTRLGDILEDSVDPKYTISDTLWEGHLRRKASNEASGKGFGYSLFSPESTYTNTLSARYYKDGSEILIDQGNNNPRKLTPRECARLQGFPEEFIIPVSDTQAYKQFGNSVAVPVIRAIASQMIETMQNLTLLDCSVERVNTEIVQDEGVYDQIYMRVTETSNEIRRFTLLDSNQKQKSLKSTKSPVCILAVENEGCFEPIVIPKDLNVVSRCASDYRIVSGKDATEIYSKYGIYISKLQNRRNSVRIIRLTHSDYKKLSQNLEELTDRLIHEVETAIDIIAEQKELVFSEEERNRCFSRTIMKILSDAPAISNKSISMMAI